MYLMYLILEKVDALCGNVNVLIESLRRSAYFIVHHLLPGECIVSFITLENVFPCHTQNDLNRWRCLLINPYIIKNVVVKKREKLSTILRLTSRVALCSTFWKHIFIGISSFENLFVSK